MLTKKVASIIERKVIKCSVCSKKLPPGKIKCAHCGNIIHEETINEKK